MTISPEFAFVFGGATSRENYMKLIIKDYRDAIDQVQA
jgi:hypothetical protein